MTAPVEAMTHDLREPLPFADASFDACYSHMLYCMAFTVAELRELSGEIRRVLRPEGLAQAKLAAFDRRTGGGRSRPVPPPAAADMSTVEL